MNDDPLWATAIHEAGHAVAACAVGLGAHRVTILPDEEADGHCHTSPFAASFDPSMADYDGRVRRRVEQAIMIMCAGGRAQARVDEDEFAVAWGQSRDLNNAFDLALWASGGEGDEATAYVEWLKCRTTTIIWDELWWAGIESLATALLSTPTLSRPKVRAAIQHGLTETTQSKGVFRGT